MPSTNLSDVTKILMGHGSCIKEQSKLLQRIDAKVDALVGDVGRIQPRPHLPPLRKPTQGIDYSRSFNVAGYLDAEIRRKNEERIGAKYLEFEDGVENETLNGDAMRCLEGLFHVYLEDLYGSCTWREACQKEKMRCEKLIREAANTPELAVFAQGAYWWPIRELETEIQVEAPR